MGNEISIINKSEISINVALRQIGILHWQNSLEPGETARLGCGCVLFTVEATADDGPGFSRYCITDCAVPIVLTVGGTFLVVGLGAVGIASAMGVTAAAGGPAAAVAANVVRSVGAVSGAKIIAGIKKITPVATAASTAAGKKWGSLVRASICGIYARGDPKFVVEGDRNHLIIRRYDSEKDD